LSCRTTGKYDSPASQVDGRDSQVEHCDSHVDGGDSQERGDSQVGDGEAWGFSRGTPATPWRPKVRRGSLPSGGKASMSLERPLSRPERRIQRRSDSLV